MRITKDLATGTLFMALGLGAMIVARNYDVGTLSRMGPGYFPILLSGLVTVVGLVVFGRAVLWPNTSEPLAGWQLRPLAMVLAGVLAFGALVDEWGLVVSVVALIFLSWTASRGGRLRELLTMVVVLTAISATVFIYVLGVPLQLGPW